MQSEKGIVCFHLQPVLENIEVEQTKRDTFILMDMDDEKFKTGYCRNGAFSLWQKNDFTMSFIEEYLTLCEDKRMIDDTPSQLAEEDPRYIGHRHDQSIFSLLTKKYDIPSFVDPSQ